LSQTFNKTNNKTLFILDGSLDFDSVKVTKVLSRHFNNKIGIKSYENNSFQENFFTSWSFNSITSLKKESKFCFLLSSNLKVESAILNAKIRLANINSNLNVYSLIQNLNSNFLPKFVNLNLNNILNFCESRLNIFSKLLIKFKNPIILLGNTLENRGINLNSFTSLVKNITPTAIILNILGNCNTAGHTYLNINSLNSKNIQEFDTFLFMNIKPNLNLHKYVKQIKSLNKEIFWFGTHGSELLLSSNIIIPCPAFYEEDTVVLNLEERPQKILQVLPSVNSRRSLKDIFSYVIENSILMPTSNSSHYDSFNTEMCSKPFLFKTLTSKFSFLFSLSKRACFIKNAVSVYPFKTITEDFYCSTLFTKNSKTMLICSNELRKKATNFNN